MKIQNCLVGVMLVLSLHLKAQQIDYRFQNLSPEKGLSHPDATCMYQDSVGFIWIGTYSGLNRYDGNRIDHFFQNAQQGDRVYINRLNYLASDSAGIIWLGTQGGLSCFDPVLEKYIPIQILRDPEEHKGVVRILIQGKDIWVITEDLRPKRYRQMGKGIIEKIPTRLPLENANFYSFAVGPKGGIWFSTERGIIQWSSSASNMFTLTNEWGREVSPNQILFDSNGSLVAGIPRGFIRIKQEDLATPVLKGNQIDLFPDSLLQSHKVTPNILVSITDILEYEDGTLWFSSFYGCIRYHEGESPNLRYFQADQGSSNRLLSNSVQQLMLDRSDCLWMAGFGGGLNWIFLKQSPFYAIEPRDYDLQAIPEGCIRSLLPEGKHQLWIATREHGLSLYDLRKGLVEQFRHDPEDERSLASDWLRYLIKDRQNRLWVATQGEGISILDINSRTFNHIQYDASNPNGLGDNVIFSLGMDVYGQVWAGSWHSGLHRIRYEGPDQYEITRYHTQAEGSRHFFSDEITFIYPDPNLPEIFVGTKKGLGHIFLDEQGEVIRIQRYYMDPKSEHGLSSNFVWPMFKLDHKTLFVGTIGGGLNEVVFHTDGTHEIRFHDEREGLPNRDVESMQVDRNGSVWMGTGSGLVSFDPKSNAFFKYQVEDGLLSNSFKVSASCVNEEGYLFFGGLKGVNYFHPDSMGDKIQVPAIPVLTQLYLDNRLVEVGNVFDEHVILPQSLNSLSTLKLAFNQNNFSINFSPMYYANMRKCRFRYKLEGFDQDWIELPEGAGQAVFANLESGGYTFRLQVSNPDGIWNPQTKSLQIDISFPWWATNQAYAAYLIIGCILLGLGYVLILRWIRLYRSYQSEKKKEEIYQMRMDFFVNISHEFRTPLTLILKPLEQLMKKDQDEDLRSSYYQMIYKNTHRLLQLIGDILDFRKLEKSEQTLKVNSIPLVPFLQEIAGLFEEWAIEKSINMEIDLKSDEDYLAFDPFTVERICINLLSNALKYTPEGGKIRFSSRSYLGHPPTCPINKKEFRFISSHTERDKWWILISDSGSGMTEKDLSLIFEPYYRSENDLHTKQEGSGLGLPLVKSLVVQHKGEIRVFSSPGKGTEFWIGFPKSLDVPQSTEGWAYGRSEHLPHREAGILAFRKKDAPSILTHSPRPALLVKESREIPWEESKILIVEDNPEMRFFLSSIFLPDYVVLTASDGQEGWEMVNKYLPDLVVSDLMMPRMDGNDLCKRIRAHEKLRHLPFIMLTAKDTSEAKINGLKTGVDLYLRKPFEGDELLISVQNMLKRKSRMLQAHQDDAFFTMRNQAADEKERKFLDNLIDFIEKNLDNTELDTDFICKEMGLGRTNLYYRIKETTGKGVMEFVKHLRMQYAARLLSSRDISIYEVMDRVGISSRSHFSKSFRKEFGKSPSNFVKELESSPAQKET